MAPQNLDLFDDADPADQVRAFQEAFDQWLDHQRTAAARKITLASSIRSYTVLWQAFAEWCLSQTPVVGLDGIVHRDPSHVAARGIHRGLPELVRVHLAQAFVTLAGGGVFGLADEPAHGLAEVADFFFLAPLAFAAHAGSLLLLTGTPVNIIVSEIAAENGGRAFGYFEFALVGLAASLLGVALQTDVMAADGLAPKAFWFAVAAGLLPAASRLMPT